MTVRKPAGAASSSSAPGAPRGRPVGVADVAPRVARRVMAADTALLRTPDNPYRIGSAARARYELYKAATTIGAARTLGATPTDLKSGIEKAYAQLQ